MEHVEERTKELKEMKRALGLLNVDEVMFVTGWGDTTVRKIMDDEEFPALKIGKENQVSFQALREYVSTRRIKRGN